MKSSYSIPALGIGMLAAACLLAGCAEDSTAADQPSPAAVQSSVGVLISVDEPDSQDSVDGTLTTWQGTWDLSTGSFTMGTSPEFVTVGEHRQSNLISWNGDTQYLVWDAESLSTDNQQLTVISCDPGVADGTIWGPGYQIEITPPDQYIVTRDGEDPILFENIDYSNFLEDETVDLDTMEIVGCDVTGNQLVLVCFDYVNEVVGETTNLYGTIMYITFDLDTKEATCSKPVQAERAELEGLIFWGSYPILDQKMYLPSGDSVAYFDLETETIVRLDEIPGQLETLLPGIERVSAGGPPVSAMFVGRTEEVVIAAFYYREADTVIYHTINVAIQGDQIVGMLDQQGEETQSTVVVYNSALQQTSQVELPAADTILEFPMMVSPL